MSPEENSVLPNLLITEKLKKKKQLTIRLFERQEESIKNAAAILNVRPSHFIENAAVIMAHKTLRDKAVSERNETISKARKTVFVDQQSVVTHAQKTADLLGGTKSAGLKKFVSIAQKTNGIVILGLVLFILGYFAIRLISN